MKLLLSIPSMTELFPADTLVAAVVAVGTALALLGFLSLYAGITSVVERKIAGRMQSRIGPNYILLKGWTQFIADGLKNLEKEDIIPTDADRPLFRMAPYVVFVGMFLTWAALPFGPQLVGADFDIGILYIFAVASLNVVGIIMAGWASNNKWSMIGGIRAAAQIVSYEIPAGLAALVVILQAGSLSMQTIIGNQGALPWSWHLVHDPFTSVSFFIMFIALLAEGNRTPFDIPEAESELVSGYNTEYSGFRFLLFFFAEWANIYVMSAILTTFFLGGWQTPFPVVVTLAGRGLEVTGPFIFIAKSLFLSFVIIHLRWTLPRLRVDQLMQLCWKYLIPAGFACVVGILFWMLWFPLGSGVGVMILSGLWAALLLLFAGRVIWNLFHMKARLDLNFFP